MPLLFLSSRRYGPVVRNLVNKNEILMNLQILEYNEEATGLNHDLRLYLFLIVESSQPQPFIGLSPTIQHLCPKHITAELLIHHFPSFTNTAHQSTNQNPNHHRCK